MRRRSFVIACIAALFGFAQAAEGGIRARIQQRRSGASAGACGQQSAAASACAQPGAALACGQAQAVSACGQSPAGFPTGVVVSSTVQPADTIVVNGLTYKLVAPQK